MEGMRTPPQDLRFSFREIRSMALAFRLDIRSGRHRWVADKPLREAEFCSYVQSGDLDIWVLADRYTWNDLSERIKMRFAHEVGSALLMPGEVMGIYLPAIHTAHSLLNNPLPVTFIVIQDPDPTNPSTEEQLRLRQSLRIA